MPVLPPRAFPQPRQVWPLPALLLLAGCFSRDGSTSWSAPAELPVVSAELMTVTEASWPTIVRTQGSLVADEVAVVGAKVEGRVALVHVDLGDEVRAGDPLVTLDQEQFRMAVAQAEAQLAQARAAVGLKPEEDASQLDALQAPPVREEKALWEQARAQLERVARLRSENSLTQADYDQYVALERVADARYASALNSVREKIALIGVRSAELALAEQRLADTVIRAPFDGPVQQRHVAPGVYVHVGDPIATVVRTHVLRFRGSLPERYARELAVGQEVHLRIETLAGPRTARVSRLSPALDELSRALLFEVELDNADGRLRTGLFAEAEVIVNPEARSIVVPHSAVVEFAGTAKVWKLTDGVAAAQLVETGQRRPEGVQVLGGLSVGDVILRDASAGRIARYVPSPSPATAAASSPSPPVTHAQAQVRDDVAAGVSEGPSE